MFPFPLSAQASTVERKYTRPFNFTYFLSKSPFHVLEQECEFQITFLRKRDGSCKMLLKKDTKLETRYIL